MMRVRPMLIGLLMATLAAGAIPAKAAAPDRTGASFAQIQADMAAGKLTSEQLVMAYLDRIAKLDRSGPRLHAVIALNPDALAQARALDRERKAKGPRGPLHGVPILLKDNIESADPIATTAGSRALNPFRHAPADVLGPTALT